MSFVPAAPSPSGDCMHEPYPEFEPGGPGTSE